MIAKSRAALLIALVFLASAGIVNPAAADNCGGLAGVSVGDECRVSSEIAASGAITLTGSLRVLGTGRIVVPPTPAGNSLTLNVAGDVVLESPAFVNGGEINGSSNVYGANPGGIGATITVTAGGQIVLLGDGTFGAAIVANGDGMNCSGSGQAGKVVLVSQAGDVLLEAGSKVTANAQCPAGEVSITAADGSVVVDGLLEAASGTSTAGTVTRPRGGPITVNAAAYLSIGASGKVSSRGQNPGADLVHLEAGLDAEILGLVESVAGIVPDGLPNRCTGAHRPDKPAGSTACVEIWVGGSLVIDSVAPAAGFVHARTTNSATMSGVCCSWIDIFTIGDIQIHGRSVSAGAPYTIDASQFSPDARAGIITIKAVSGTVMSSGRAIIANASTFTGGLGGTVVLEALSNIDLFDSSIRVIGANIAPGGAGQIRVKSFNGQVTGGSNQPTSILFGELNASGFLGTVDMYLQACVPSLYTGVVIPLVPAQPGECGGSPSLPAYAAIPTYLLRPTITIIGAGTFVFDGSAHAATAMVTGVNGENLGAATITYSSGSAPSAVGSYAVTASWPGNDVYRAATATEAIVIIPSNLPLPIVSLTGGTFTYDGQPHGVTASATGTASESLAVVVTYNGSTQAPVNAGTYAVVATFAGSSTYGPASATATLVIDPATPIVSVVGGVHTYDGNQRPVMASARGARNEPLAAPTVSYLGQTTGSTTVPQFVIDTFTVSWTLAASQNYRAASGQTTLTLNKATVAMTVLNTSYPFDNQPHAGTAMILGVAGEALGLGGATGTVTFTYSSGSAPVAVGSYTVSATFSGNAQYHGAASGGTIQITPAENKAPVCTAARPSVALWPPNHKLFGDVSVLGVTDPDGDAVTITITGIFQDEPVLTLGDGTFEPDAMGVGTPVASVRRERSGSGNGRVYEIRFRAADARDLSCTGAVLVGVPKNEGSGNPAIDDGLRFDSTFGVSRR